MYEVLCECCWHTEAVVGDRIPEYPCPSCRTERSWVGPFVKTPERFSHRASWPVLTSPHYAHAGKPDRQIRAR